MTNYDYSTRNVLAYKEILSRKHAILRLSRMNVIYPTYKTTVAYYCVPAFVDYILNTHCVNNDCICCGLKTT